MRDSATGDVLATDVLPDAGFWRLSWLVAMRHWAIYRKDLWANMLPTVVDPVLFIMVFGYWLGAHITDMGGRTYLQYMAPGLAVTTALFTAFFESSYGFFVRMTFEHIFKALMTTPVGPNEILAGEFIWVALKGAAMASGVSLVLLGFQIVSPEWLWLVPVLGALVGLGCGAIGLIATAMVSNINQFQTVYALLISPMFFISGVFYPVEQMPRIMQLLSWLSPLWHGVKIGQALMWAEGSASVAHAWLVHGSVLVVMSGALMFLGVRLIRPRLCA